MNKSDGLHSLFIEIKRIYPAIQGLRNEKNIIEFTIQSSDGVTHWFPHNRLPIRVEKYINAWIKINKI